MKKEFGRIVDGKIVETGISEIHFGNREIKEGEIYMPVRTVARSHETVDEKFIAEYSIEEDHILRSWRSEQREENEKLEFSKKIKEKNEKIFSKEIEKHMDKVAKGYGYNDLLTACTYAGYLNPYQAEGQAFVEWRGNVWAYYYDLVDQANKGKIEFPKLDEIINGLPALNFPTA